MTRTNLYYLFLFIFIYFFLLFFKNPLILGDKESTVIWAILQPHPDPLLLTIQKAASTIGGSFHGIGYALLGISKVLSKLFVTNIFTIKAINIFYGLLALYLFFKIIVKNHDIHTAYLATGLYLTNFYFQAQHLSLVAQPVCITLIFFCIMTFQNLNFDKPKSYLLVIVSSSLLLMNYIIGRIVFLIIIIYFSFLYFLQNKKKISNQYNLLKKTVFKFVLLFFIILIFLVIINPNNFSTIISLEIFDPPTGKGERFELLQLNIFDYMIYNINFIYNNYILGPIYDPNSYLIQYSVPHPLIHKYLLIFFLIGFIFSIRNKSNYLYYLIFFTIIFLISLSQSAVLDFNIPDTRQAYRSTLSYRLYILIPFIVFFISKGIIFFIDYLNIFFKNKILNKNIIVFLFIIFGFIINIKEKVNYNNFIKDLKFKELKYIKNDKRFLEDKNLSNFYPKHIWYHLYMKGLASEISDTINTTKSLQYNKDEKNNLIYIFIDENDYSFNFIRPDGVEPDHKYETQIFLNLYLNQTDDNIYEYLITGKDYRKWYNLWHYRNWDGRKIRKLKKIFFNIMPQQWTGWNRKEKNIVPKYIPSESSYFFKSTHVILFDDDQYKFALRHYPNNTHKLDLKFTFLVK